MQRAARALVLKESGTDSFDDLAPELQEQATESVKAVVEALREPSEAMALAARDNVTLQDPASVWPAMIDAAMDEG
jgi:hypothetical protein